MDWKRANPDAETGFRRWLRFLRPESFQGRNWDRLMDWMNRRTEKDFHAFGCECLPREKGKNVRPGRSGRETE